VLAQGTMLRSPREWEIWGSSRPNEKHWDPVLRRFMKPKINNDDSRTAAAASNAPDWSVSHYIVFSSVKNLPPLRCGLSSNTLTTCYIWLYRFLRYRTKTNRQTHGSENPATSATAVDVGNNSHLTIEQQWRIHRRKRGTCPLRFQAKGDNYTKAPPTF